MKKICLFLIAMFLFLPVCFAIDKSTTTIKEDAKESESGLLSDGKSAILIDATTGKVLYEKNVHERFAPASMTKIMSMLLIMESIEEGNLKWDEKLVASEYASSMGGSQIFLQPNEKMSVKDLFKAVAIGSANDATIVFAERIAGTEKNFVNKMNKKAQQLGLKDTNFKNAVGLDEANHYSSAYDMAIMAKNLVKHEEIFKYTTIYEDYLRQDSDNKFWLVNTNKLIKTYEGADGLKTGYTKEAGYCLTATAKKGDLRLIGVIMGAKESNSRNSNMATLLDYGFNSYDMQTEIKKGSIVLNKKINKAKNKKINIITKDNLSVLVKKGTKIKGLKYDIKLDNIKLPIKKGETIGTISLKSKGKTLSKTNLIVNEEVKKANIFTLYYRLFNNIISGNM